MQIIDEASAKKQSKIINLKLFIVELQEEKEQYAENYNSLEK